MSLKTQSLWRYNTVLIDVIVNFYLEHAAYKVYLTFRLRLKMWENHPIGNQSDSKYKVLLRYY